MQIFAVKPRITVVLCLLMVAADALLLADGLSANVRIFGCFLLAAAALILGVLTKSRAGALIYPAIVITFAAHTAYSLADRRSQSISNLCTAQQICCQGTICDTRTTKTGSFQIIADVSKIIRPQNDKPMHGRVMLTLPQSYRSNTIKEGDRIILRGKLATARDSRHPWDFNEKAYFQRSGISARIRITTADDFAIIPQIHCRLCIPSIDEQIKQFRERILALHRRALGDSRGNFFASIVLGNRNVTIDSNITNSFRTLGLSHLLAASGFNLTIVVGTTWALLRWFIRSRPLLNLSAWLIMLAYVQLAGMSASVLRAAFMASALLLAGCLRRRCHTPAVLALALVTMIAAEPMCLMDAGLQLSYAATAGLILCGRNWESCVTRTAKPVAWLIDSATATIAAQLSVLPIQLYYFWQVGLLSLPANLLVAPLIPLITVCGFTSSALSSVLPERLDFCLIAVDQLAGLAIEIVFKITNWLSSYKWALINTGQPSISSICFYYCAFVMIFIRGIPTPTRIIFTALLIAATCCLLYRKPLPGDAVMVCTPESALLIDSRHNCIVLGKETIGTEKAAAYFACESVDRLNHHAINADTTEITMADGDKLTICVGKNIGNWQPDRYSQVDIVISRNRVYWRDSRTEPFKRASLYQSRALVRSGEPNNYFWNLVSRL